MTTSQIHSRLEKFIPVIVFAAALIFYGASAAVKIDEQSKTPQYVYLAYSFLHGRTDLVELPPSKFDLISYQGKWYVPGGMTPALLMIPVVAFFGLRVSDILFGVVIGAINVLLMFSLMGKLNEEKQGVRLVLTLLFAAGTVHWWISSIGSVWFNALLVGCMFMILFAQEAIDNRRPWLAGAWLGLAGLARPTTLFALPFYLLLVHSREGSWRAAARKIAVFGMVLGLFIGMILSYNYWRFSSPFEFGYGYVYGSPALTDTYARTGGFSPQYMPCNMYVSLLGMPNLSWNPLPSVNQVCWYLEPVGHDFQKASSFFNPMGMSIFLTTPAFLLIFRARKRDDLTLPAWAGMISVLLPLWMYHATGWTQFGYRYLLDFIPFIFILLSLAIRRIGWLEAILIGFSVIMGYTGLNLMYYLTFGLNWTEMFVKGIKILISMIF